MQVVNTLKSSTGDLQLWLSLLSKMYVPNISVHFVLPEKSISLPPLLPSWANAHPCYEALNREGNNSLNTLRKGR